MEGFCFRDRGLLCLYAMRERSHVCMMEEAFVEKDKKTHRLLTRKKNSSILEKARKQYVLCLNFFIHGGLENGQEKY